MAPGSLLILIPAYNEERRIGPTLERFARFFRDHFGAPFQILVVLNGCRDNTLGVVQKVAEQFHQISWVVFPGSIGKGGALIEGLKYAEKAEYIGYVDADGSTGPESFIRLVQRCETADCVVGSRRVPGAVIRQAQPTQRMFASKIFHAIVELLFGMRILDTQCGAKVLRRDAVLKIYRSLHIADMAFDINLLYSLKQAGLKVVETPVEWTDDAQSTVRYFRTSLVMFLSVVRLRLVHSPFYKWLKPLRPLEGWLYVKLLHSAPPRRSSAEVPEGASTTGVSSTKEA